MAVKFTEKAIEALKPKDKAYIHREGNGFAIRIYTNGKKSWLFIYTFEGNRKWYSLGSYPEISLKEARQRYREALKTLENDKDPGATDREEKEARRKEPTVSELIDEYMEKWSKPRKRSWKKDQLCLKKDVVPAWGKRKARDITRRDVILLLESILERGAPIQSNNVLEVARRMFNFAVERSILEFSPFAGVKPLGKKVSRKRHLNADEIKTLWSGLDDPAVYMSDEVRRSLKLILVTGQRPGECIGIHWREIDGRWWTIPAERSKNGREHRVYLSNLALELLGEPGEGFVFPSPRNKPLEARVKEEGASKREDKAIDPNAVPRALRRNIQEDEKGEKRISLDHFTPHDLRRTTATHLGEMGYSGDLIGKILNHVDRSVTAIYNRHHYDKEKQKAMEAWERRLREILTGKKKGKVLELKRA